MDGQSMTELRGPGGGGGNTNWKTLAEVKNEHLGHGDKVCRPHTKICLKLIKSFFKSHQNKLPNNYFDIILFIYFI